MQHAQFKRWKHLKGDGRSWSTWHWWILELWEHATDFRACETKKHNGTEQRVQTISAATSEKHKRWIQLLIIKKRNKLKEVQRVCQCNTASYWLLFISYFANGARRVWAGRLKGKLYFSSRSHCFLLMLYLSTLQFHALHKPTENDWLCRSDFNSICNNCLTVPVLSCNGGSQTFFLFLPRCHLKEEKLSCFSNLLEPI